MNLRYDASTMQSFFFLFGLVAVAISTQSLCYAFTSTATIAVTLRVSPASTLVSGLFLAKGATMNNDTEESYVVATELLETVLERWDQELDSSFDSLIRQWTPSYKSLRTNQEADVESLIQELGRLDSLYDPTESLLGPLYCTVYTYNEKDPDMDPPLWETISLRPGNLKGQQLYLNENFQTSVINYAEIWGDRFAIRALASFDPVPATASNPATSGKFKNPLANLFSGKLQETTTKMSRNRDKADKQGSTQKKLRSCPDLFVVDAFQAEFCVSGQTLLPIPIKGQAKFVVLYADPRVRVFVSPAGSRSTELGQTRWEQSGLVAVQVRSDLVTADQRAVDLR